MQGRGAAFIRGSRGRHLSKVTLKENLKKVWEPDTWDL